ncbi:MAG: aldehyde dehydrogenase [Bacteroidales bacterium]
MNTTQIIQHQKDFFASNQSKDIKQRIEQLKKLRQVLKLNEKELYDAIYLDFKKSPFETYTTEFLPIYNEIALAIKNIKSWSKPKKVSTGLLNFPAKSYIIPEPLGTVLIIGAWNYPYQLSLIPAINALAAGNTVILKPSEIAPNSAKILTDLINTHFEAHYLYAIEGDATVSSKLLEHQFDKIFFTGSTQIGKIIYQAAAKHLSPVTLELGGKCPCFVFEDCNLKMTAKRLVWAKFMNAGQTCVAPDYVLLEKSIEEEFITALKDELKHYPQSFEHLPEHYTQIINTQHFDRLSQLIDPSKIIYGGVTDRQNRFISPSLLNNISFEDPIMREEIFGPLLPIIPFDNLDETIKIVKNRPKPLACYIYAKNKKNIQKILHEISFGGGAINESMMHLTVEQLPFGGVGHSGIGNYHGKAGFDCFSHQKSILHKSFLFEPSMKYPPLKLKNLNIIKRFFENK